MAALVGAALVVMPMHGAGAQPSEMPMKTTSAKAAMPVQGGSERDIKQLHDQLHITAAQEELWGDVAQTMRDNAKTFQAGMADMAARGKSMNAVDNLKFMQVITDQHSSALKQIIPPVEALYASLSPEQKKQADGAFAKHNKAEYRRYCDRK